MMSSVAEYSCFGVYVSATVCYILGFSSPWWISSIDASIGSILSSGLWMECVRPLVIADGDERWRCTMLDLTKSGAKTLVVLSILCTTLLLIACDLGFYVVWLLGKYTPWSGVFASGFSLLAGILGLIGVALYGSWHGEGSVSWSYVFCATGTAVLTVNGLLFLVVITQRTRSRISQLDDSRGSM